jgi:hypothetical protein
MEELSHLSVTQLILMMGRTIPIYNAKIFDCDKFQAILNELKSRPNLEMMFFAGEHFNNKKRCLKIHYKFGNKYKKSRLTHWLKFQIHRHLRINKRTKVVLPFLHLCLENIQQHVKKGFAIVILETLDNRCIKLAIIDNGTGFIDKDNQPVLIEDAISYNYSFGKNGHKGQALWWMVQNKSPVTLIKQAGEVAVLTPVLLSSTPTIKPLMQLDDTYGTTFIALFNYHKKPVVTMVGRRLRKERERLEQEVISFFTG